jgi:hypothetical protein
MSIGNTPTGLTQSQGWEIGIRRSFPIEADHAWEMLFTQPILSAWLDDNAAITFKKNDIYTSRNGVTIKVSSVTTGKVVRMKWQQAGTSSASTLQIRVIPDKNKTTIAFHHEWLKDAAEREEMKTLWEKVLKQVSDSIQEDI